ncbi:MAG: sodium:solute symporter [Saprospiraceae bacterium]|nr:sodium:solute symporter [Saprospiraceae bacterium]
MEGLGISPVALLTTIVIYFALLYIISYWTSRKANTQTFFTANKNSSWILVAVGMIGASLSGVTFISIPGVVGAGGANQAFAYMQMVLGYLVGYAVIALVLMPIYYKYQLTTIYGYLEQRFGWVSYKMGAFYFIISRVIGASLRLYLVAIVLHPFVLKPLGVSFELTVIITLLLIWVYTFRGGIKTIVVTDTIQTAAMLLAVGLTIYAIAQSLDLSLGDIGNAISDNNLGQWFFFENGWSDPNNFYKQFLSGALIAIVMTGLDQDMMQKNLTCRTLKDAQKNIFLFSIVLVFANILFLSLGAILYIYAWQNGIEIPTKTDQLYPLIALNHLSPFIGIVFVIGLIAAAYSSADSALTSLTTSFCIDFLDFGKKDRNESEKKALKLKVHIAFTVLLFAVIIFVNSLNNDAVINGLFTAAGYTYGPILGLYSFGIFSKRPIKDKWVWIVVLIAPLLTYIIDSNSVEWFNGLKLGYFILAVNGLITTIGLFLLSMNTNQKPIASNG